MKPLASEIQNIAKFSDWSTATNTLDYAIAKGEWEILRLVSWPHVSAGVRTGVIEVTYRKYTRAPGDKNNTNNFPIARPPYCSVNYPIFTDQVHYLIGPGFIRVATVKTENHQIYFYLTYKRVK